MTNHYTDVCEATIESLRQQLELKHQECISFYNEAETVIKQRDDLRQQLASRDAEVAELRQTCIDHVEIQNALRKQVTLLRDALMFCQSKIAYMLRNGEWYNPELALDTAREALAVTEPK